MRYLLDTEIFIAWLTNNRALLTPKMIETISNPEHEIYVSTVSFWDMTIQSASGSLMISAPLNDLPSQLEENDFKALPITPAHVLEVVSQEDLDAFTFLLISQALHEDLTLITHNQGYAEHKVKTLS